MRFGAYLGSADGTREDFGGRAELAERLGFESLWMGDHVIIPKTYNDTRYPYRFGLGGGFTSTSENPWFESISALCYVAGRVEKPRLGLSTLVTPYRNPILAAKMLSTLDVLSGGRLVLGVGTGWMKEEFDALRTAPYEDRGAVTDEYVEIFIELWTKDDPNYQGKHYQVSDIGFLPKPVQKPHPPIWVGGHTGRAFRRLARYGQGWQPHMLSPQQIAEHLPAMRRALERVGRSPDDIETAVSARPQFDSPVTVDGQRLPLTGSTQQVLDDVRAYQEVGVDEIRVLGGSTEVWDRFAQEIMPRV